MDLRLVAPLSPPGTFGFLTEAARGDMQHDETWLRRPDALWRTVLGDVVILTPDASEPFALRDGARLWELLAEPHPVSELDVPTDLLADLCQRGAVERHP